LRFAATAKTTTAAATGSWRANAVAWRELYFEFDNFIPLFFGSVALWHGEQFFQATTRINGRGRGRGYLLFGVHGDWHMFASRRCGLFNHQGP